MNKAVKRRGFTIVELVIVIAVIAVLAAVLIPTFSGVIEKARESAAIQEALGAYTEYLIEHADEGNTAEYLFYKTENKVVVLSCGAVADVYETEQEALKATLDNPETPQDESAGYTLGTLEIDGLYFMQSGEQECNHSYVSVVTAPTCVKDGYTTHTCSLCGDNYTDSETPATGEHSYNNGVCSCGAEESIIAGVTVGSIGNTENEEEWCFDIVTTEQVGIYQAVITRGNTNSPADNLHFVYYTNQLLDDDIPEIELHKSNSTKGFELEQVNGDATSGSIKKSRSESDVRIQLPDDDEYRLILDFINLEWRIEKGQQE